MESTVQTNSRVLAQRLVSLLVEKNLTITCAESCTGGLLASELTSVSGASECFKQSVVTYSNESKVALLGVSQTTLERHGAVSAQTADEMVRGLLRNFPSSLGVAITGIAGPGGGSLEKPVGTVFIAYAFRPELSSDDQVEVVHYEFTGDRDSVRWQAVSVSLSNVLGLVSD